MPQVCAAVVRSAPSIISAIASIRRAAFEPLLFDDALRSAGAAISVRVISTVIKASILQ